MPPDAPSYVERQADHDLFEALCAGEFCYVLTARQMGKSSLMVRTAARLRHAGVAVAILDLTAVGQNLEAEQWYDGLLALMGRTLGLEDELEDYWLKHRQLSPLQRWTEALRGVVLSKFAGPVVLFVDEIDAVRSLPFSADEFFAAIRETYNWRAEDAEYQRLTFCMLGVATPSDLIRDTRTTPFNIGRRIQLTDFSSQEAAQLAQGLGRSQSLAASLLHRILHWTGGHPYLTQRFCHVVAGQAAAVSPGSVDGICEALFLSQSAREQDDNLQFVRDRMLRGEVDVSRLLELYRQVFSKKRVKDDEANPQISVLRLSGIARATQGYLYTRNRIYFRVFDLAWIRDNMPDAEIRRQRTAYRQGVIRAAAISGTIVAMIACLAAVAVVEKRRAVQAQWTAREALYSANMNLAKEAADSDNLGRTMELLDEVRPLPGEPDPRGWEWRYLWRLCHLDLHTLRGHTDWVTSVAFSPDGKTLATASRDRTVRLWNAATGSVLRILSGHTDGVTSVVFSPDGKALVTASLDKTAKLWDAATGREVLCLRGHTKKINSARFSPDGKRVVTASMDGSIRLWDADSGRSIRTFKQRLQSGITNRTATVINEVQAAVFSPDGTRLFAADDGSAHSFDVATGRVEHIYSGGNQYHCGVIAPNGRQSAAASGQVWVWDAKASSMKFCLKAHTGQVRSIAFSPNSRTLASASDDSTVKLWDMSSGRELITFRGHTDGVRAVAFSPSGRVVASGSADGSVKLWLPETYQEHVTLNISDPRAISISSKRQIATAGVDGAVRLWDAATGEETHVLFGQSGYLDSVRFSPDGSTVTSTGGSHDPTARIYDAETGQRKLVLAGHSAEIRKVAYSPDNKLLATASDDATIRLWNLSTGRVLRVLRGHAGRIWAMTFSPDGRILASGGDDRIVRLWDVAVGRVIQTLPPSTSRVTGLAFAASGKTMAAGSSDNSVRIWEMAGMEGARRIIRTIRGHRGYLEMAYAPDGNRLATLGGGDGNVRMTNTSNGREAFVLKAGRGVTGNVAFSPDGTLLAYRSGPLTFRLCYAPPLAEIDAYERAPDVRRQREFEFRPMTGQARLYANLGRLIRSSPSDASLYRARATIHAEAGRWKQAAADFSRSVKLGGADADSLAVTKLAAGDRTDLRETAEQLKRSALTNRDPLGAVRTARFALLIPGGLSDPAVLIPVIKSYATNNGNTAWRAGLCGLGSYRAGRYRKAIEQLEVSLMLDPNDYDPDSAAWQVPFCWLLLSMSHQRLGHSTEARFLRARAVRWIDTAQRAGNGHEGPKSVNWRARAQLIALRREAEALIGKER